MARQAGPLFIIGTVDDMVFYKMNDNYYMRRKGEPTSGVKKRMKHDKGYALLQLKQSEFGEASKLVRKVYYTFPKTLRKHGLFGKLTGKAVRLLREGKTKEKIKEFLLQEVLPAKTAQEVKEPAEITEVPAQKHPVASPVLSTWQVSAKGTLATATVKQPVAVDQACVIQESLPTNGQCRPYAFNGTSWSVRYTCG